MIVLPFREKEPKLGKGAFVAPNAAVIGDVEIGEDSSVWFGTVVRGDLAPIRIGARTNIQDNCVLHVDADEPVSIADEVTIGHSAIVHGCTIGRGALIGMGSRILGGAVVGEYSLVGAGAVVSEGMVIPPRTLVLGIPARAKRPLTDDDLARLDLGWQHYVEYKEEYLRMLASR